MLVRFHLPLAYLPGVSKLLPSLLMFRFSLLLPIWNLTLFWSTPWCIACLDTNARGIFQSDRCTVFGPFCPANCTQCGRHRSVISDPCLCPSFPTLFRRGHGLFGPFIFLCSINPLVDHRFGFIVWPRPCHVSFNSGWWSRPNSQYHLSYLARTSEQESRKGSLLAKTDSPIANFPSEKCWHSINKTLIK